MKYVVIIPVVLLVVTLALFTSIYPITVLWKPVFASPDTAEDYVNIQSDVDSVIDKGTHSNFTTQKYTDLINDTLTEADQAPITGNSENFVDSDTSDVDGHADHGTSSNFTAQQDSNAISDTLTEANTSNGTGVLGSSVASTTGSTTIENQIVGSLFTPASSGRLSNIMAYIGVTTSAKLGGAALYRHSDLAWIANTSVISLAVATSWRTFTFAQPYPAVIAGTDYILVAWSASGSGNGLLYYGSGVANQGHIDPQTWGAWPNPLVPTIHNAFMYDINASMIIPNYELDMEFQWTTIDYAQANEYVCIHTGSTFNAENILVKWRNGGSWTLLVTTTTANTWYNTSLALTSDTLTLQFLGGTETGDTTQSTWMIECSLIHVWTQSVNYELELEEQFTDCDYTHTFEELCIYMGAMNGETLSVQWWNSTSNSWLTIIASLSSNQWNNVSVVDYLTSATFTIRFVDGTKENDLSQGTWQKDSCLLHTWTLGYNLNLRVLDQGLTDHIQGAYVYKDSDIKTSDADGWANWTEVSGTVQIKVQYYGFWVNGTFSIAVSADTTIDVQCNLYDISVKTIEAQQSAYLVSANVTVFNSTSDAPNKIATGVTGSNGIVELANLPNYTLTFTQYGGSSYTIVIGNATQPVSNENQSFTITADQNNVSTSNTYSIIAFAGMTIPLEGGFVTKRLKRKMYKKRKRAEINEGSQEEVIF